MISKNKKQINLGNPSLKGLLQLARSSLTEKQLLLLEEIKQRRNVKISLLISDIQKSEDCSESVLWKSLKQLKSQNLVKSNGTVRITKVGRLILEN